MEILTASEIKGVFRFSFLHKTLKPHMRNIAWYLGIDDWNEFPNLAFDWYQSKLPPRWPGESSTASNRLTNGYTPFRDNSFLVDYLCPVT